MIGHVDDSGRALVAVSIRPTASAEALEVEAWIDTGFSGDLVLPLQQIEDFALPQSGTVGAILADGSQVTLKTHSCLIEWFGKLRELEVVTNQLPIWRDCHRITALPAHAQYGGGVTSEFTLGATGEISRGAMIWLCKLSRSNKPSSSIVVSRKSRRASRYERLV
jgi:predicted aspartyl protease